MYHSLYYYFNKNETTKHFMIGEEMKLCAAYYEWLNDSLI